MKTVVFVAPYPMQTTLSFARAVAQLPDVRLLGVVHQPPSDVRGFTDMVRTDDALNPAKLVAAIDKLAAKYGKPDRILGILEQLQQSLAAAREHYGVPGPGVAITERFRDKALMKDELRRHGLPCAAHRTVRSDADAWGFANDIGFPLVLKPPAGAGCKATYRVDGPDSLKRALAEARPSPQRPTLAEEFLAGAEFSFETLTVGGEVLFHSIGRYYPGPLEVMQNPHLQWVCLLPRDITGPAFDAVRDVGPRAVRDLGLSDGMTHMEWFKRHDGSIAIGEIAARPPGAQIVKLMSHAYETDFFHHWANAVVHGRYEGPWERKYSVGVAFLRGPGKGRITRVEGLEAAQRIMGELVVEAQLPKVGMHKSDSYEGDGFAIVRHRDTEVVKTALLKLIETVKVHYEA